MKKFTAVIIALALLLTLSAFASAGTAVGSAESDWRITAGEGATFAAADNGLLMTNPAKSGSMLSANLKEAVELDGFEFTVTPTMWSTGHWISFTVSNKADYQAGNTDHAAFGDGLMIICQYVSTTDYICIIPYSINENGFASATCDIGVIGSEFMYSTEDITFRFQKDDVYGYIIFVNGKQLNTADGGAAIDMTCLERAFPDGKAYFGAAMLNSDGSDIDTLLIKNVTTGNAAAASSQVTEPSSDTATVSSQTASQSQSAGCGNKA